MGSRVLLADDSVTIQKVVGIIFANEDYELIVVDSGDAALQKAREVKPDVMLVDALMPGKNGYEVCSEIRRDPQLSHIALLLMTGAFEVVDEEKNRQSGADEFITKPFESQALIDMTSRLIALSRERASRTAVVPPAQAAPQPAPIAPAPASPAVQPSAAPPADDIWGAGFDAGFAEEPPVVRPQAAAPAAFAPQPPAAPASDDDLWGVFDMDAIEPQPVSPAPPIQPQATAFTAPTALSADDFFPFDEEPSVAATPSATDDFVIEETAFAETVPEVVPGAATGFEPFGEQEFSFGDVEPQPAAPIVAAPSPVEEDFSTISFDEPTPPPAVSSVAPVATPEPVVPPAQPEPVLLQPAPAPVPPAAPVQAAPPAAMDEEQLKMLLSRVSREVIEKIVWEVVPDLAESIIREEIRKIKEGIDR